jgi:uncharacterized protein with PIN domain/sulfur carrier protein ThiS
MKRVEVRFYAQLNDFLLPSQQARQLTWNFDVPGSVKDMIESLGVPHTEVDLILANGEPVDFDHRLQDGQRIAIYPAFRSLDLSAVIHMRREPMHSPRFIADTHLGRLAAYLRLLGFDTLYSSGYQDEELAKRSAREERILLTRDSGLLMRAIVGRGYCLRAIDPAKQVLEVMEQFDLVPSIKPFSRCMHCNALLRATSKEAVSHRLLPETKQYYDEFFICPECDRIYWKGSHYQRMQRFIESLLRRSSERNS